MWRDSGSSVSSQCMSTSRPRSAAISHSSCTLAAPSAMVRSKCGMPPTTSTPRSSARSRLSTPPSASAARRPAGRRRAAGRDRARRASCTSSSASTASSRSVADVDVAADGEQALRHRPVAIGERALDQRLGGQQRLQLAPERDAFEQRAAGVDARQAVAERRVHVEVRIDEGRRDQQAAGVDASRAPAPRGRARLRRCGRPARRSTCRSRPSGSVASVTRRSSMAVFQRSHRSPLR